MRFYRIFLLDTKFQHKKNKKKDFVEISKNLDSYRSENNFLGPNQNNWVGNSSIMSNVTKSFDNLELESFLYNYSNNL